MADCPGIGKRSWPELVGRNGRDAEAIIERQNRNVNAIVLKEGTQTTADIRCDRVRVWVNDYNVVTRPPVVS